MPRIAVIGLGRFGMSLARQLGTSGAQVIAIDRSINLVNEVRESVDVAAKLDSTDIHALESQDIGTVDICVVAIGENFEASLLTTVIAKKMGIPKVICRAQTQVHAEIFRQIGADEVIQPEVSAGDHLGLCLANEHISDFLSLSDGFTIIELRTPTLFADKSLRNLTLRDSYDVNLVAIKRLVPVGEGEEPTEERRIMLPKADDVIAADDLLVVVGTDESLGKIPRE